MNENQKPTLIKDLGMMFPKETSKQKKRFGIYQCQCGAEFRTQTDDVKSGRTESCGCTRTTHGLSNHILFQTWKNMIERTSNPKYKAFRDYGGRGIAVCERWKDVSLFIEDMQPSYQEGLSIDRIDNNGNYSPDNCRWETRTVQSRNTRLIRVDNKSGHRGVGFHKASGKWVARIGVNGKHKHLGLFTTAEEAAKAYDRFVIDNNLEHTINGVL